MFKINRFGDYMNKQELDILNSLRIKPFSNQRNLAKESDYSLGLVNSALKSLIRSGYINDQSQLCDKAKLYFEKTKPRNAIILAAGFGMRMVPINTEVPKGLIEVRGETLIERLICQLHEADIHKIHIVVGYMKEQYEYLMDKYNVNLIVNPNFTVKNNLHSLKLAHKHLNNSYIVPCDIWFANNPFDVSEPYSWYMVSDEEDPESSVRVNRKMELVRVADEDMGNAMIGLCYLENEKAVEIKAKLLSLSRNARNDNAPWEDALYVKDRMAVYAKRVSKNEAVEVDTYEQLRELDKRSNQLKTDSIQAIANALDANFDDITNISVLKKGITNRSFLFSCKGSQYIMRIPGEGTDALINREQEGEVYKTISGYGICDEPLYFSPQSGYKITKYLEGVRVCDPENTQDVARCMTKLRAFHELSLRVDHHFDIFHMIQFYEDLWESGPSIYKDYQETKKRVFSLQTYIDAQPKECVLTHIDPNHDNFLFSANVDGTENIQLIDWEYSGMQDPHVDLAMFCIYALYDRAGVDNLIDAYFIQGCEKSVRIKIYCYISACGLLWSNWCEYKRSLGVDFGEYSLRQYRYAKDYDRIVQQELQKIEGSPDA